MCYPAENLEEEYRERYVNRGNTEDLEYICRGFSQKELEAGKIDELRCWLREKKKNIWLQIDFLEERLFYQIKDIDNPGERQFIYDFGKRLYDIIFISRIYSWAFDLRQFAEKITGFVRTVKKEQLSEILENLNSTRPDEKNEHNRNERNI